MNSEAYLRSGVPQRARLRGFRLALVTVVLLSLTATLAPGTGAGATAAPASSTVAATLVDSGPLGNLSPSFFAVNAVTHESRGFAADPAIGSFLNSTPIQTLSVDFEGDYCNATSDQLWTDNGTFSAPCAFNVTAFKGWCDSIRPACTSTIELPGENNNSAEDAYIANWIVHVVGIQPEYFVIGNEPNLWKHYGEPWSKWRKTDAHTPTELAYAIDVRNAILAIRKVDPGAHFLGIETDCICTIGWIQEVATVDRALISGIAYHSFPPPSGPNPKSPTLAQFYDILDGSDNISTSYDAVISGLAACTACAQVPILIGEFNAGPPQGGGSTYTGKYPNAVFMAASFTQAWRVGVVELAYYDLQDEKAKSGGWGFLNTTDAISPVGILYQTIAPQVVMGTVHNVHLVTALGNAWVGLTTNATASSLLVVNANITDTLHLSLGTAFPKGGPGIQIQWNPSLQLPTTTRITVGSNYTIPPQGILLIRTVPPLQITSFTATPATLRADATTVLRVRATGGDPPFTYEYSSLPPGCSSRDTSTLSCTPIAAGDYTVEVTVSDLVSDTASAKVSLTVTPPAEYPVQFEENGLPGGTNWAVTLNGTTNSSSLSSIGFLEFNGTYSFSVGHVTGFSTSPKTGKVVVQGSPLVQDVSFTPAVPGKYPVNFTETGLPTGTQWSVDLNGSLETSTTSYFTVSEINGTYPFKVEGVAGYIATPLSGTVVVNGAPVLQSLTFASVEYAVTFGETGLPLGTNWGVTLGPTTVMSSASSIEFTEPNGTYPFQIPLVGGYVAAPPSGGVTVKGGPLDQPIAFSPLGSGEFSVNFKETGLSNGTRWSVVLNGTSRASTEGMVAFTVPSGTYRFVVGNVTGYGPPSPSNGSVSVAGSSRTVSVSFTAVYGVTFSETTLAPGTNWSVTVTGNASGLILALQPANRSLTAWSNGAATVGFHLSNGTYTFVAEAAGYAGRTGSLTVGGRDVSAVEVGFPRASGASSGVPLQDYLIAGAGAGALAVVVGVFVMRRRKERRPDSTEPPPESDDGTPPPPP
jgi:hypothetical protein